MTEPFDYEAAAKPTIQPSDDKLTRLRLLANQMLDLQAIVEDLEAAVKAKKDIIARIAEVNIPDLMVELDIKQLVLGSGQVLKLDEPVFANISEERSDAAHDWLDEHNFGSLVKRQLVVAFRRDQEEDANALVTELAGREEPLDYKLTRAVASATLKKWAREQVEEGTLDEETKRLFGIYCKKLAKITDPPKSRKRQV